MHIFVHFCKLPSSYFSLVEDKNLNKSAEFWAEIEESGLFITLSNFKNLEEDNEEAMDVEDDEDVLVKLFILNVTGVNDGDLLTTSGDEIVTDEAWDETTEFSYQ